MRRVRCFGAGLAAVILVSTLAGDAAGDDAAAAFERLAHGDSSMTTVFLVRHADREDDSADSPLSEKGHARARELGRVLGERGIERIHSSDYARTRETAAPLAKALEVDVELYDPRDLPALSLKLRGAPGRHLVVGHSDTTPKLVGLLGGDPVSPIDHDEYGRLYVVGIGADGRARSILTEFGERSHATQASALAEMMTGYYSSAAQAEKASDDLHDIRLTMAPIWASRHDGPWLYVEQASASALDRPYRQRVYHLVETGTGPRSDVFELPGDPLEYAGAWRDPARFDAFGPSALIERPGCSIYLTETTDEGEPVYAGSTRDDECKSSLRGASFATSEVTITDRELTRWDRGFDAQGAQVWGPVRGPYVFLKYSDESGE